MPAEVAAAVGGSSGGWRRGRGGRVLCSRRASDGLVVRAFWRRDLRAVDRRGQEDTRLITFSGAGEQALRITTAEPLDIARETNAELSLLIDYNVRSGPTADVKLGMDNASVTVTNALRGAPKGEWRTLAVPLKCFAKGGAEMTRISTPLVLGTSGRLAVAISDIRVASAAVPQDRCSL